MYYDVIYLPTGKERDTLMKDLKKINKEAGLSPGDAEYMDPRAAKLHIAGYPLGVIRALTKFVVIDKTMPQRAEQVNIYASEEEYLTNPSKPTAELTFTTIPGEKEGEEIKVLGVDLVHLIEDVKHTMYPLPTVKMRMDSLLRIIGGTTTGFKAMYIGIIAENKEGNLQHEVLTHLDAVGDDKDADYIRNVIAGHGIELQAQLKRAWDKSPKDQPNA